MQLFHELAIEVGGALEGRFSRSARSVAVRIRARQTAPGRSRGGERGQRSRSSRASGWRGARPVACAMRPVAAAELRRAFEGGWHWPLRKGNDSPSASRRAMRTRAQTAVSAPRRMAALRRNGTGLVFLAKPMKRKMMRCTKRGAPNR